MLIGCDPEFLFSNSSGDFVPANRVIRNGDFGTDGHSATGELRPKAGANSLYVVSNLRKLIKEAIEHEDIRELNMHAGHYKFDKSIGGHIHISGFEMNMDELAKMLIKVSGRLSDCIDNITERSYRGSHGYGIGERSLYRRQNTNWIEFRRPGSWLISPQVAFMNLWLAEATAYAYINSNIDALASIDENKGCDSIVRFASHMKKVPNYNIFIKAADRVFTALPIDWAEDFKGYWV
jgi:hypothetical protein